MKKHKRLVQLIILAMILAVGVYTIGGSLWNESAAPPKIGEKAPAFELKGLDGNMHNLSDYRGKTVILNFWGSFCEPCVDEMPLFQEVYEENMDKVVIVGVNLSEPEATVRGFVKRVGVSFPILLDRTQVQKRYGVAQYPTTFIIDEKGTITHKKIGEYRTKQELEIKL